MEASYARKHKRLLLTNDQDFMDDREFPFHRNSGVIVPPGTEGEQEPLAHVVRTRLSIFGTHTGISPNAKIAIGKDGIWIIRRFISPARSALVHDG